MNALNRTMLDLSAALSTAAAPQKQHVSYQQLVSLLDYSPDTGEFRWRKRSGSGRSNAGWNARYVGKVAGSLNQTGYRQIKIDGRMHCAHKLAWLWGTGEWPSGELDHINRCRDDNRVENLRPATRSQNCSNTKLHKSNTTGFRGVCAHRGRWEASIGRDGKRYYLGAFRDKADAAAAYDRAARAVHGDFHAPLNFNKASPKQSVFITKKTYGDGGARYEVLVAGEYYGDLSANELAALQAGISPEDLQLYPLEES